MTKIPDDFGAANLTQAGALACSLTLTLIEAFREQCEADQLAMLKKVEAFMNELDAGWPKSKHSNGAICIAFVIMLAEMEARFQIATPRLADELRKAQGKNGGEPC